MLSAQKPVELPLWPDGAPNTNGLTGNQEDLEGGRVANVVNPSITVYRPAKPNGMAVIMCPGGGYGRLAMNHEGHDMAAWFTTQGITYAVLKYRMPNGHPEVPLEDVQQALRIMAGLEAGTTGFTADKVGIMGFSAGGHLAASAATMLPEEVRPAFAVLIYPVITAEPGKCHKGAFDHLLGTDRTAGDEAQWSLQNRVTASTPPTLLLLADDDRTVPPVNSTLYYNALKAHGIEASIHIYPLGGHGWGIRKSFRYKAVWQDAVLDWLRRINE